MQQTTQTPTPPAQPTPPAPPQGPTPQPPKKSSALKWVLIILGIIIVLGLIVGVGCWFVGKKAVKTLQKEAEKVTEQLPEEVEVPGITPEEITEEIVEEEVTIHKEFPKDFPIYTGAKVESSGIYMGMLSVALSTSDSASKVFKWYKDEIPKAGYEVSFEIDTTEGKTIGVEGKEYAGQIMITEEEERTDITITLSRASE